MGRPQAFIGLMSGTSLDGIDGVVIEADDPGRVLAHEHQRFDPALRAELLALNLPGYDELRRAALAANALSLAYARVVEALLDGMGKSDADIRAIGAHGQTVRHQPLAGDGIGFTLQLLQGALLAERCGIDVVCDFRSRDIAAAGQGAPLVPAYHQAVFGGADHDLAVLNLGGIANLTLLPAAGAPVRGFDCGPANVLLDSWCLRHLGQPYDRAGRWGASGQVHAGLLAHCLGDPYFARRPPKSTGRDHFNDAWLADKLRLAGEVVAPADVQATLMALTVGSIVHALREHAANAAELVVCGGGAFNDALMADLAKALAPVVVRSSADAGLPPDQVEAAAFAWLAHAHVSGCPGSVAAVTGARGARILGALYPA